MAGRRTRKAPASSIRPGTCKLEEVHALSVAELANAIESGALRSVDITEALIARVEAVNPTYRAFITPTFDLAMEMARAADAEIARGHYRGPLHGIPIALKDAYDTEGIRTTVCSRLMADRVPDRDAHAWQLLRAAGAVLLGKLECTELCLGGPSDDGLVPHSRNPWDVDRYAGGSSSGAGVALATGMVPAALGSDTGGSIRIPAAFCGVAGHKPTYGLVSTRGLFPLSGSLDHAGPMARTSRDCALLLDAIAGHDPRCASSATGAPPSASAALTEDLAGVRVGYVRSFAEAEGVTSEARAGTEKALTVLEDLGATVREQRLPDLWDFTVCNTTIMLAEAFAIHMEDFRHRAADVSYLTRARIALGAYISATDYIDAQKTRRELARATRDAMADVDVLIYPAMVGDPAKTVDIEPFYFLKAPLITAPANVAGVPAAAVRCGFSDAGMPMSFQVTGRLLDDATVLRVGHAYETATPEFGKLAVV